MPYPDPSLSPDFDEPDAEDVYDGPWERFTKRTDGLKLLWLERRLTERGIPHRRNGESWHAPITEVAAWGLEEAWMILVPVDDLDDDDPRFEVS